MCWILRNKRKFRYLLKELQGTFLSICIGLRVMSPSAENSHRVLPVSKLEKDKQGVTDHLGGQASLLQHTLCGFYEQCISLAVCLEPCCP